MAKQPSIFISYAQTPTDSAFVDQLEAELSKAGFDVWVDRQRLEGGALIEREIEAQISRRNVFIVALSPDSVASTWVRNEIVYAINKKKPVIPLLARDTSEIPLSVSGMNYLDFRGGVAPNMMRLRLRLDRSQRRAASPPQGTYSPAAPINRDIFVPTPELTPEPPADLERLYLQGLDAMGRDDLGTAEALLAELVRNEPNYDAGRAAAALERVRQRWYPLRIEGQVVKANAAHRAGQWGLEIELWKTVLGLDPLHQEAQTRLRVAEQNQQGQPIYRRIGVFVRSRSFAAARDLVPQFREVAPNYGDPEGYRKRLGIAFPLNYLDAQEQARRKATRQTAAVVTRRTFLTAGATAAVGAAVYGAGYGVRAALYNHWLTSTVHGRQLLSINGSAIQQFEWLYHWDSGVYALAWSPGTGKRLALGTDNYFGICSATSGDALQYTFFAGFGGGFSNDSCSAVAFSPDGSKLAAGNRNSQAIVCDVTSIQDALARFSEHTADVNALAWSPDGSLIASASNDHTVRIWRAKDATQVRAYKRHTRFVRSVAWSPDGSLIASAGDDKTVQIWRASDGVPVLTYTGHRDVVWSVAWSPDGTRLASASNDKSAHVWRAADGTTVLTYTGHSQSVNCVSWSPDGSFLATGSDDQTAQVWNAAGGARLLIYTGHSNAVGCIAWSPDGAKIASGSADATAQIWTLEPSSWGVLGY